MVATSSVEYLLSERYEALIRVSQAIGAHRDPRDLFRAMTTELHRVVQFDGIVVAQYDEASNEILWSACEVCSQQGPISHPDIPVDETIAKWVFLRQEPLLIPRLDQETRFPRMVAFLEEKGFQSVCALPLTTVHRRIGSIAVASKRSDAYCEEEVRFLSLVADQVAIAVENALAYREIAELKDRLAQEKVYLEDEIRSELNFEEIVGRSPALRSVLQEIETVAPTDSTVLIYGETGTGKELIARAIHNLSTRSKNNFVKLNCAAIPTGLLESEMFGHEKGAFTGAVAQRIGRFELANHGTVFLEEIGEIPLELQPKLLRVLQEREFERLGSSRTLRTDARLIAATNRDLAAMVEDQKFRADLFYRLNVFPVHVPPLRERQEDIPLLVRHFVQQFARRMGKAVDTIPAETMNVLVRYHWPGNIRELQNMLERAVILSAGPVLKVPLHDLHAQPAPVTSAKATTLQEAERRHILEALDAADWVISGPKGAATALGLKRSTLQARMEKLGIRRARAAAPSQGS
jgi:formate hydrogenlyase transcriptional activator